MIIHINFNKRKFSLYFFSIHDCFPFYFILIIENIFWGARVVQSVKPPALAQVMILQFVSLSPTLGSVLTA